MWNPQQAVQFLREVDLAGSEEAVRHLEENCAWAADLENNDVDNAIDMASIELHTEFDETPVHACLWVQFKCNPITVKMENNKNFEASPAMFYNVATMLKHTFLLYQTIAALTRLGRFLKKVLSTVFCLRGGTGEKPERSPGW